MKNTILLVDDDRDVLKVLDELLNDEYETIPANSGYKALEIIEKKKDIAAIILDIKMPGMDGIETGLKIRESYPEIPIIFHTAYAGDYDEDEIDVDTNPFDFVPKGNNVTRLFRSIRNAVSAYNSRQNLKKLNELAEKSYGIVGKSKAMQEVFRLIAKVAESENKVMIRGESGTGKELVAKAIHNHSLRRDEKLAILNCNHKSPDMVESELFGHKKGSFTGAYTDRVGLFEYANKGSVFLDEIGDLDITTQAKLLRVLETGEYERIGAPETRLTDIRLICATHRNLEERVKNGEFREDLYFRLKGIIITVPPLHQRKEDIPLLVEKFVDMFTIKRGLPPKIFEQSAMNIFLGYDWPGNVRQLMNTVESIITLTDSDLIVADDVRKYMDEDYGCGNEESRKLMARVSEFEKTCIIEALTEAKYNIAEAARLLEIDRANLYKKLKKYNLSLED